ncbi:HEAT repeat-containing protein 4 [Nowakowskiella sp. JEL0078]|nr:HEAT repeat-containing protein 4 [Nowakowskiella sp. JEL0078]
MEHQEEMCGTAIEILLGMFWNDWCPEVRNVACRALTRLKQGKPVFDWIVKSLQAPEPSKRTDALRCLSSLNLMNFAAKIRLQVLELKLVVCQLKLEDRDLINAVLDRCGDFEWKVRAYAVKAIGLSGNKEPKIREILSWFLLHEVEAAVRAEAVRAVHELGLVIEDSTIRETLLFLNEMDRSDLVRNEAEIVLSCIPTPSGTPTFNDGELKASTTVEIKDTESNARQPIKPPHIFGNVSPLDFEIFMRDELIGQKEEEEVIRLVKEMTVKERIIAEMNDTAIKKFNFSFNS